MSMSDDVSTSNNNDVTDELISHAQNSNSLPNLNDEPSIQFSMAKLVSQPFPTFNITLPYPNIKIVCEFYTSWHHSSMYTSNDTDCSANLKLFDDGNYKFTPTENMINVPYISHLHFYWNISVDDISNITFGAELLDIKKNHTDQITLQNYIGYLNKFNFVSIQGNKQNKVLIEWTRMNYLIRDWTNYLGFPNHHIPLRIAKSTTPTPTLSHFNQTEVLIYPYGSRDEYFEIVETEKRFETVLSNIGPLGGAISLLLGAYAVLFGGSLLDPWGIFQKCCCKYKPRSKRKLLKNLSMIPLIEKNQLHYGNSKDPDLISLITRFNSLEIILREYVINTDFLNELETEKIDIESN
nr:7670_t:CDS:10 [Entrophospora candida]